MRQRLKEIAGIKHAARRGIELERFTADLFRLDHFRVQLNPGTARPRQTDLIAIKVTDIYLIECKWRSDRANIDDIDSLRSRLRRADTRAIGILLSCSGFTEPVVDEVLANRVQPILLVSGDELQNVATGAFALSDLLWRKRQALLIDGKVLLDEPTRGRRASRLVQLPHAEHEVLWPDGTRTRSLECAGGFRQFVFTHELPNIDWVSASGRGVTLDVTPQTFSDLDLVDLLETLANMGWSTSHARWSIQQSRRNWHGWGSHEFAAELKKWQARAKTQEAHHSEEIFYTDVCDGGFYTIAASLSAHSSREIRNMSISFQFQGHPLDTRPLLELCHTLGVHEGLYLRPRDTESVQRLHLRHEGMNIDTTRALIIAPADSDMGFAHWVTGVVIDNPFTAETMYPDSEEAEELRTLKDSEYVICDLMEHHALDEKEYRYFMDRIEFARSSDGLVRRAVANWRYAHDPAVLDSPDDTRSRKRYFGNSAVGSGKRPASDGDQEVQA